MVILLAAGLLIRAALYFPLAMFQIDSDGVLAGLCAFHIGPGHYPAFFPGGTRLSAASCYVALMFFGLIGPGRVGLALTGLTWGALYLLFMLLFLRALFDAKRACLAFLFAAIPSEQFVTVTYVPWGYGEIMASCAATLWLAALWRKSGGLWQRLFFGLSVGLGLWISLQTIMVALPSFIWVAVNRRHTVARECIPALLGVLAGSTPFLLGNLANGFASLTQNWASRPVSSIGQVGQNLAWLISSPLAKLLFHWYTGLDSIVLIAAYALVAIGFVDALRRREPDSQPATDDDAVKLLLFVVTSCVLIFIFSQAGSARGWTVRYIAPLYLVVPLFLSIGVSSLSRRSHALAIAAAIALLLPSLLQYSLPGSVLRSRLTAELKNDSALRDVLAQRHIRFVYGDYFWVYHLSFDTREQILGIPTYAPVDYLNYADVAALAPARWAMLGGQDEVLRWARAVGARGTIASDGDLSVFLADRRAERPGLLLERLRRIFQRGVSR
jgi:hypothetical protein